MHPGTAPFYSDPENAKVAAAYGILIGSSHAEPMLRNNVGEWDEKQKGHFNYITNKDSVYAYWEERVKHSGGDKVVYTLGMRGVHDSGIEGVKTAKEAVPLLERIIDDQRNLLKKYHPKDAAEIPQVFTAYKEVLDIYDNGLRLPDDVTLVWPDDNYGYIQRLNNADEQKRSGGSGVYYHASYWGRPHDYLWLSSTHPSLIREEMMKAYENKTNRLWVLNVGDIKPLEYNIQLFLDMAFDAAPFKQSVYTKTHLQNWAKQIFGQTKATAITNILWQYYNLAFERRPEFMGWSQTEPTTKTNYTAYNHFYFGDEAQRRIDQYEHLQKAAADLRKQITADNADAFYQLVYYPLVSASWMNKKFLYRDKAFLYARQNRLSALDYAKMSNAVYDSIAMETEYFNQRLSKGKWKGMMSMKPRELPVYQAPDNPAINIQNTLLWDLAPEGYDTAAYQQKREKSLPAFTKGMQQQYFIDVYLGSSQTIQWKAKPSAPWILLSKKEGVLTNEKQKNTARIWITIDWNKAPKAEYFSGQIIFEAAGRKQTVKINALQPKELEKYSGHTESNGQISIYANSFVKELGTTSRWQTLKQLGHTGTSLQSVVSAPNSNTVSIEQKAGYVGYEFYSLTNAAPNVSVFTLPTHPLNKSHSMRYGVSIDDGAITTIDFKTIGRSEEWKQNVLRNLAVKTVSFPVLKPGKHTLKIYAIDPGVILDRILINFSSSQKAYSVVPETIKN